MGKDFFAPSRRATRCWDNSVLRSTALPAPSPAGEGTDEGGFQAGAAEVPTAFQLNPSRAPAPRPAGTPVRHRPDSQVGRGGQSRSREKAEEAGRPPLLTRTRLLTAACTADTGAVRSGMAFPSTSPSSCMMTRWEICWATGSRMLSMVRVWKTGMAAAGWGAGARTQHKLLANSVPAGWRPTEKAAASAQRKRRKNRKPNDRSELPSPRSGVRHTEKRLPAQAGGGGTRTRCPPATRWQRPPRTGAAPHPGGGFSTGTSRPSRGSRPWPPRPMAEPRPPLPVAQRRVHQHSRASFPLRPLPFPHRPPSQPSLAARALVSQSQMTSDILVSI